MAEAADERRYTIHDFELEGGDRLAEAVVVYATHGTLNAAGDNAVLVPSHYQADVHASEWLVGTALDPSESFIVLTELFGNGRSSSPSNTPAPHDGPRFPVPTIRDNVEAVYRLLTEELGVARLRAVVGFSMGAMQAYQWGVSHPGFVDAVVATCGTAASYPHGRLRLDGLIQALETDPAFAGGDYDEQPVAGISAFGINWAPWLYSQKWWRERTWLETDPDATYESLAEGFRNRFMPGADANNLILHARTWQAHDVGTTPGFDGDTSAALGSITARVLALPSATDLYFPVGDTLVEARSIPDVTVVPIPSIWGHPAGSAVTQADADFVSETIRRFLAGETIPEAHGAPTDADQLPGWDVLARHSAELNDAILDADVDRTVAVIRALSALAPER